MSSETIKSFLASAIDSVSADIGKYSFQPEKDFTRPGKLPPDKLISFLIGMGSSSTRNDLYDFFGLSPDTRPTPSAFTQQRAKLKPEALEAVLKDFNAAVDPAPPHFRFIAADGSTATFQSSSKHASDAFFVDQGHSQKGFFSIHINALYDLDLHTYKDALLQPVHNKDEFRAFCDMVDRYPIPADTNSKIVFIGDRGYCSYNNMAHVRCKGQYFLFRTKDSNKKGLIGNFDLPDSDSFDVDIDVSLCRRNSSKFHSENRYLRFIGKEVSFDFIEYGSDDLFDLSFRVVRFPLKDGSYECIVTDLPRDRFPSDEIKKLYFRRWGIETSFRKLKYTIGLSNFHSRKPVHVCQEIWARMIMYNYTETLINQTVINTSGTKHTYKVNFSVAAHICRLSLRLAAEAEPIDVISLLQQELIPVRDDRQFQRLKTAHFRKPRHFIYRAA